MTRLMLKVLTCEPPAARRSLHSGNRRTYQKVRSQVMYTFDCAGLLR